jgi:cell division protein FtsB
LSLQQVLPESELDVIAQKLSKVYNMPPEEVKKTLQIVFSDRDRLDRLREKVSRIKELKPVLDEMPEEVRHTYYSLILREIIDGTKDEDFDRTLKYAILRDLREGKRYDDEHIKKLEEKIEETRKMFEDFIKAQQNKPFEELSKKVEELHEEIKKIKESPHVQMTESDGFKKLLEQVEALRKDVDELKKSPQSLSQRIETTFKEVESIRSTLEKYGLIPSGTQSTQGGQVQINPERLAEELKKYGYEVRRITPEDMQKYIEEYKKRVRDEVASELQIEKARIESIKELIKAGIDNVIKPIMDSITDVTRESLRQSIRARMMQYTAYQQQAPQQPKQETVAPAPQGASGAQGGPQGGSKKSG